MVPKSFVLNIPTIFASPLQLFKDAVEQLSPGESVGDACSVSLKTVVVAALPTLASRHNASGLPHSVKNAVDKAPRSRNRVILVSLPYQLVFYSIPVLHGRN